ncbi:alpha/beta hydrolase [Alteromonas gracilis]
MTTQILLVPGFWLGEWAWDDVVPHLRERGYAVRALTLPGLAPDASEAQRAGATSESHARAMADALDRVADRRVVVVHSGAAVAGTVLLDRHPDLIDHMVFVDTSPVADGYAMAADLEGDLPLDAMWEEELEQGAMRDLSEDQLATFRERAVPEPGGVLRTPVSLHDDRRNDVPATVVCTAFDAAAFRAYAEQGAGFLSGLLHHRALTLVDLPTGHWPMWSRPAELADVIAAAAERDPWG